MVYTEINMFSSEKEAEPEEFEKMRNLEEATNKFKEIVGRKKLAEVVTLDHNRECEIALKDGTTVQCLVMARDEDGDWTILTIAGETREYTGQEVA